MSERKQSKVQPRKSEFLIKNEAKRPVPLGGGKRYMETLKRDRNRIENSKVLAVMPKDWNKPNKGKGPSAHKIMAVKTPR